MPPSAEDADHLGVGVASRRSLLQRDPELGARVGESVVICVAENLERVMPAPGGGQVRALGPQPKAPGGDPPHSKTLLAEELDADRAVPQVCDSHLVGA